MAISMTLSAPTTRWSAALPGARAPQTTVQLSKLSGLEQQVLGLTHVPAQASCSDLTANGLTASGFAAPGIGMAGAERRIQAAYGLPTIDNRKQYVHKTRVNADGGGASGPEPEREQALQKAR